MQLKKEKQTITQTTLVVCSVTLCVGHCVAPSVAGWIVEQFCNEYCTDVVVAFVAGEIDC